MIPCRESGGEHRIARANPSCTASRASSRSPVRASANRKKSAPRRLYTTSIASKPVSLPITDMTVHERGLFTACWSCSADLPVDQLRASPPNRLRPPPQRTLVMDLIRAVAELQARRPRHLREGDRRGHRLVGAEVSRAMLQTMICGGAEHSTAVLKLNRAGLRSRALLTSCPLRYAVPRDASAPP